MNHHSPHMQAFSCHSFSNAFALGGVSDWVGSLSFYIWPALSFQFGLDIYGCLSLVKINWYENWVAWGGGRRAVGQAKTRAFTTIPSFII